MEIFRYSRGVGPIEDELDEVAATQAVVIQAIRVPDHPGTGRMSANRMRGSTKIKRGEDVLGKSGVGNWKCGPEIPVDRGPGT